MKTSYIFTIILSCVSSGMFASTKKYLCCLNKKINESLVYSRQISEQLSTIEQLAEEPCAPCSQNIIPISQNDIPFVISQPGRYCLTENIVIDKGSAITIDLEEVAGSSVAIDLNGYTISGFNGSAVSGNYGITTTTPALTNNNPFPCIVEIYNGTIVAMTNAGINIPIGLSHLNISSVSTLQASQGAPQAGISVGSLINEAPYVIITDCVSIGFGGHTGHGFALFNCTNFTVERCSANGSGLDGFYAENSGGFGGGLFIECAANNNMSNGFNLTLNQEHCIARSCTATNNGSAGFLIDADYVTIDTSIAHNNDQQGYLIRGGRNSILSNQALGNTGFGFDASSARSPNFIYANYSAANGAGEYNGITNVQTSPVPSDPINATTNIAG